MMAKEHYEQTRAEKLTKAYTNPANEDLMAKQNRKGFIVAGYYFGIAIAMFLLSTFWPDIEGTTRDTKVLDVFRLFGWALLSATSALMIALLFARGLMPVLLFGLNWIILPAILIDGLMQLSGVLLMSEGTDS